MRHATMVFAGGCLVAAFSAASCGLILGIDEFKDAPAPGSSSAGGGGQGGREGTSCEPGATRACYPGPPGTEDIGDCRPGMETCDAAGEWSEVCQGAVVPGDEICGNSFDEDCDGIAIPSAACLVNRDVVVRYFIDEAKTGQGPVYLQDGSAEVGMGSLPLLMTYSLDATFTEIGGHTGFSWPNASQHARASIPLNGTKIFDALHGSRKATIEAVVEATVIPLNGFLTSIDTNVNNRRFSLILFKLTGLEARFHWRPLETAGRWSFDGSTLPRTVLHLVLDTSTPAASDRVRLYVDGSLVVPVQDSSVEIPAQGETIDLMQPDLAFTLGNTKDGGRSIGGTLFYSALYATALTPAEVQQNAALLLLDDDGP